jgi:hypothetical protein
MEERTVEWLEKLTGYEYTTARKILLLARVSWKRAPKSEICEAVRAHLALTRMVREPARRAQFVIDGRALNINQLAEALGVRHRTLRCRRRIHGSWVAALASLIADAPRKYRPYKRANCPGAPPKLVEIDGEIRKQSDWLASVSLTRQGLWKAAHRHGCSIDEELITRVRARRSANDAQEVAA